MDGRDKWLETDERREALAALEFLSEIAAQLQGDRYRWKWVFVVLHNAVQAFMVLALRQSDGSGPIRDDVMLNIRNAWATQAVPPAEKLDRFLDLYRKIKRQDRMQKYVHSKAFAGTSEHDRSIKKLHELRNDFIHFVPRGWAIELSGASDVCLNCLEIIDFLANDSGTIWWNDESERERCSTHLQSLRSTFTIAPTSDR